MTRSHHRRLPPLSFEWSGQPDGITCGPTCLEMAYQAIAGRHGIFPELDVLALGAMCGTNGTTGTTHEGVGTALAGLGIGHGRVLGSDDFSAAWTRSSEKGTPVLLRTLTRGVKHWVLATGEKAGGRTRVLDPWLGELDLTDAEVVALVAPRGYEAWPLDPDVRPRAFSFVAATGSRDEVMDLFRRQFGHLVPGSFDGYIDRVTDWDLSRALLVDGALAGAYLLKEEHPSRLGVDLPEEMHGLSTVQGVALATTASSRGKGYGRILRDLPRALGYELVWGLQHGSLMNLDKWLAHRTLVGEVQGSWVTAAILPGPTVEHTPSPGFH